MSLTFAEARALLKQKHFAYHSTFGSCDATEHDVALVSTVTRVEQKYRKCYEAFLCKSAADLKRTQQVLERKREVHEPFIKVEQSLHGFLPATMVPVYQLTQNPEARELAALVRRAVSPSSFVLNERWLNGRHYVDCDFRRPVEYVCGFENLEKVAKDVRHRDTVVDLQGVAMGLEELLNYFEPDVLNRGDKVKIKVSTAVYTWLMKASRRYIAKLAAFPPHPAFEYFRPSEAELAAA